MKKILITGASGFLGSHFVKAYAQSNPNEEIYCVSRKKQQSMSFVNWIEGDLLDKTFITQLLEQIQPDVLIHLAWDVTPGKYINSENNFLWLDASKHLIDQFLSHNGKYVLVTGTCFEYDLDYGYLQANNTPLKHNNNYAAAKILLNDYVKTQCGKFEANYTWTRVFYLYGPNEDKNRLVPHIITKLLNDESPVCTDGLQLRDYMYVVDAAKIMTGLILEQIYGEVNISTGYPTTVREIGLEIEKLLHKENKIHFGAIQMTKEEPHVIMGEPVHKKLNFNHTSLKQGLIETINWWEKKYR